MMILFTSVPPTIKCTHCLLEKESTVRNYFRKLFQKPTAPRQDSATTAPLSELQLQFITSNANARFDTQQLVAACGQSMGKQRDLNEDSVLAITSTLAGNSGNTPFGLYIVADGMGGHQFGEVASNAAIRTVAGTVMRNIPPSLLNPNPVWPDQALLHISPAGAT